jgi:hypothetical protein
VTCSKVGIISSLLSLLNLHLSHLLHPTYIHRSPLSFLQGNNQQHLHLINRLHIYCSALYHYQSSPTSTTSRLFTMAPPQSSSTSTSITIPHHLHQSSPSGPSNPTPAPATRRALHRSVFSTSTEASSSSSSCFSSSSSPKMPQEIRDIENASSPSSSPPEMTTQKREKDVASASGSGPLVAHQRRPSLLSTSTPHTFIFCTKSYTHTHRPLNLSISN